MKKVTIIQKAKKSFIDDLRNNYVMYMQLDMCTFSVEDTPKSRLAIKMAKERFGMQSIIVSDIDE